MGNKNVQQPSENKMLDNSEAKFQKVIDSKIDEALTRSNLGKQE